MELSKPTLHQARAIWELIRHTAETSSVLERTLDDVCEHIREFTCALVGEEVVGCVALPIEDLNLAEIRSLCVAEDQRGTGLGKQLVEAALLEARELGLKRVYALTNVTDFFRRLGFVETERSALPKKVWRDCVRCPKFPNCDEVAFIYELAKE